MRERSSQKQDRKKNSETAQYSFLMDFEFSSLGSDRNEVINISHTIFCYTKYLSTSLTAAAERRQAVNERATPTVFRDSARIITVVEWSEERVERRNEKRNNKSHSHFMVLD